MNRGIIGFNCSGLLNIILQQSGILHIVLRISTFKIEIHFLRNGILKHPEIQNEKLIQLCILYG